MEVREMNDKILFARDYKKFRKEIKKVVQEITEEQIISLYAIYRKDLRAEDLMRERELKDNKATWKQIRAIKVILAKNGLSEKHLTKPLEELTKEEASKLISDLTA